MEIDINEKRNTYFSTAYCSHAARMGSLLDALKTNRDKKVYVQMMNGKIRIAQEDYDIHMAHLQKAKESADILFELLAYGVLVVEAVE